MTSKNHSNPQTDRDRAEKDKERAQTGKAATVDNDRDAIDRASRQGNGPAGLNTGPSDTVSRDPHNPSNVGGLNPTGGTSPSPRADGVGQSPPQGAAPTSDRPQGHDPHAARAAVDGSPEAQAKASANAKEREAMTQAERDADDRLKTSQDKIAGKQSAGPGDNADRKG